MSVTLNGTSGLTFGDGSTQGTAGLTGFRNRLINGGFDVWQKGTSRFTNVGQGGSSKYYADRWTSLQYQQAGMERVARTLAGPVSPYAMRVTSSSTAEASAGTRMSLGQMVENINCSDLAGMPVTLSFWIRFSNSTFTNYGNFAYGIWQYTTATDPGSDSTGPDITTQQLITAGNLPTVWTKYTISTTLSSAMKNIAPRFTFDTLANTASNSTYWYEITDVQLEYGGVATAFERRPYSVELSMCERYLQRVSGTGMTISANTGDLYCPFRCLMRTSSPSYSIISGSTAAQMNRSAYSYSINNGYYTGNDAVGFRATTTDPGITAGIFFFTLGSSVLVSAEL